MKISLSCTVLMVLVLAGCGGGGGGPASMTLEVRAEEPTGPVDNSTLGNWDNTLLGVGEFGPDTQVMNNWRGILTFDISQIPPGATIQSAEIVAEQFSVNGNPYAALGSVVVDHIEMGPVMLGTAYDGFTVGGPAGLDIGTLADDATLGIKSVEVTGAVQHQVDVGASLAQFRLRFPIPNSGDVQLDNAFFRGNEDPANTARLKVDYTE